MKLRLAYDLIDDNGNVIPVGFWNACQIDMRSNRPLTTEEQMILLMTIDRFLNRLTIHDTIGHLLFQHPGMGIGGVVETEHHAAWQRQYQVELLRTRTICIDNNNQTDGEV